MQSVARIGAATLSCSDGQATLCDQSCGQCAACVGGVPTWCDEILPEASSVVEWPTAGDASTVLTALACAAAFSRLHVAADHVVLVLADEDFEPLTALLAFTHAGLVLRSSDSRDPRVATELARLRPTGRADVVVAPRDVRTAVKAVRKGGIVCSGTPDGVMVQMPSITELVQREVAVVGAVDVVGLAVAVGSAALSASFNRKGTAA